MTVSPFEVIWVLLTAACLFSGAVLTVRNMRREEQQEARPARCPSCRSFLDRGATFCGGCGHKIMVESTYSTMQIQRKEGLRNRRV